MRARVWLLGPLAAAVLACGAGCGDATLNGLDGGLDAAGDAAEEPLVADGADGADRADEALDPFDGDDSPADAGSDGDGAEPPADDDLADAGDEEPPPDCGGRWQVVEGGLLASGVELSGVELAACSELRFAFVAAQGSLWQVELVGRGDLPQLSAGIGWPDESDFDAALVAFQTASPGEPVTQVFGPPRSGEFSLRIRPAPPEAEGSIDLGLRCLAGCDRETSRYPIVLVHGWTGWDEVQSYTYFYEVPEHLAARGYPVHVASLDPYNSTEVRSGQLAEQLDDILAAEHATHVDLIAHSQGGLDSRRVISTLGYADRVSALVTISTPHRGTPIADVALGLLPGFAEDALAWFLQWLGATAVGSESDAIASFQSLTTSYVCDEFNPANPDAPGVSYISYAGKTCSLGIACGDVCDLEIRWAYDVLAIVAGDNDGMVPVDSAVWGDYRGEIPADHFDEIGQLLGVTGPNFDHQEFYLKLARDLAAEGH